MKRCPGCATIKPFVAFYKDRTRKHGYGLYCKVCQKSKVGSRSPTPEGLARKTRVCSACRRELPRSAFGTSSKRADGLQAYCRNCRDANTLVRRGWDCDPGRWVAAFKQNAGCADCPPGTPHPYWRLDFDHVRGDKAFDISRAWSKVNVTRALIEAEIAKCEVVCANCHRDRTYARQHQFDLPASGSDGSDNVVEESPATSGQVTDS